MSADALIFAYPTPSVASRHLPLTGGVGPGPLLRGLPLEPGKNFRRAKSELLPAISSGPLALGFWKIGVGAIPQPRLGLPSQHAWFETRDTSSAPFGGTFP